MFRISVERLLPLMPSDHIYVVTNARYVEAMREQVSEIPPENFIAEPSGKNTAPAALLAAITIHKRDPDGTLALLTADHHIAYPDRFREVLRAAAVLADDGLIVTLGISPSMPATGFGYIERGAHLRKIDGFDGFKSAGFTEKPDTRKAMQFLRSGRYSWNSGMFIWKATTALAAFAEHQPALYEALSALVTHIDSPDYPAALEATWATIPSIQLDTGVMERADNIAVIPVDIGWSDVGSWDALFDVLSLDDDGNGFKGSAPARIVIDTKNTLVYSDKLTVTLGIDDIVVVETPDVLMICHRSRAQDIKQVVEALRAADHRDYL